MFLSTSTKNKLAFVVSSYYVIWRCLSYQNDKWTINWQDWNIVIYEVMWRSKKQNIGRFKCLKLQGNVKKLKILKALKIFLLFKFHFMNCNSTKAWTSIVFMNINFIRVLVCMKGMTSHQKNKFYILYSSAILISILF